MQCSACGGPTKPKTTKVGLCYECLSGCKDPKKPQYALGTWPPKPKNTAPATNASAGKMTALLDQILRAILRIEKIVANPGKIHTAQEELRPDEEVPF